MANLPASALTRFGRGFLRSGAARPLAYGLGGSAVLGTTALTIREVGRAKNPPLQRQNVDLNGDGIPESVILTDTRTGGTQTYGAVPSDKGDPARNDDRDKQRLLIAGVVAAVVVGAVLVLRGG